ncbi:MAG: Rdx family protein [Anaerolineae bacterium]|nr:Rdx family protein [Anaerolineae bacterium]MCB9133082.1 SelT/SelW/SelH family protein [Anaerolineales bacterium]MCB0236140.1 Rdx family protein [Anaerolineae bacterium]MCB0239442.1 Rdx family protein [Anaerolineae bacterium]MCB0243357.1 Rdx family protein [Anaerolineae bacterium]
MTEELLKDFEPYITELVLVPSDGGRFEVTVNDELVYSKKATGRHAEYSEVADSVRRNL